MTQTIWLKALLFILGFPLITLILGELIDRLENRGYKPIAQLLINIRTLVLPTVAIWLLLHQFLAIARNTITLKAIETAIGGAIIVTSLSLLGILLTSDPKATSWKVLRVPRLFLQIARILIVLGISFYVLSTIWGVDLSNLATALGVGSLVIALALQNTLSNLVSGFLLLFDSPFKVGDWIRFGEIEGQVVDLNWRSVRLQTLERDLLVVPNSVLDQQSIYNFSRIDPLHAERYFVGFSYDDPPNFVKQVLKHAANETSDLLDNPAPDIRTISYEDFAITYEVKYYIDDYAKFERIRNELSTRIFYAARRNGLTIPFPIRTLHHVPQRQPKRAEHIQEIGDFLRSLPYFTILAAEAITNLAESAVLQVYGVGDRVMVEGIPDEGFYIIRQGSLRLYVTDAHQQQREIAHLAKNDFFGETALHPGKPSLVTGVVEQDLTVLVFGHEAIAALMASSARFANQMNQFIEDRKTSIRLAQEVKPYRPSTLITSANGLTEQSEVATRASTPS
ncbi:MAG: mechanosensitive ion channel [Leptolyngbya sp. SIOISBB]|nr:mechanosensitive ion channel [Leptolyngbya sp. SIOISBB]